MSLHYNSNLWVWFQFSRGGEITAKNQAHFQLPQFHKLPHQSETKVLLFAFFVNWQQKNTAATKIKKEVTKPICNPKIHVCH